MLRPLNSLWMKREYVYRFLQTDNAGIFSSSMVGRYALQHKHEPSHLPPHRISHVKGSLSLYSELGAEDREAVRTDAEFSTRP
jgi:alkylated DNA nucleotide flippase Atl1